MVGHLQGTVAISSLIFLEKLIRKYEIFITKKLNLILLVEINYKINKNLSDKNVCQFFN